MWWKPAKKCVRKGHKFAEVTFIKDDKKWGKFEATQTWLT